MESLKLKSFAVFLADSNPGVKDTQPFSNSMGRSKIYGKQLSPEKVAQLKSNWAATREWYRRKMEPYAEEIRRLYCEKYYRVAEIEEALDYKCSKGQIERFLKKKGLWQGRGTLHQQISKRRLRLRNIDPNEELFKVYQLERSQERKTEALTSWANHPDSLKWHRYCSAKYRERMSLLNIKRFMERMRPFADDIRRLYCEEHLRVADIVRAMDCKVSLKQVKLYLKHSGLWQGKGTIHSQIRKRKYRLPRIDINEELYQAFLADKRLEKKAISKASWLKHLEYQKWRRIKRDFVPHCGDVYDVVRSIRNRIFLISRIKIPASYNFVGCAIDYLKSHIEGKMSKDMSWDNYGSYWNVITTSPYSGLNLNNLEDISRCFNWKQLEPQLINKPSPINLKKDVKTGRFAF